MFKLILLFTLVALAVGLKIHEYEAEYDHGHHHYEHEGAGGDSEHHHEVEHKHSGTSHQSVKFHHFHAVPVYIKDDHLLKHPVEIGGTKSKLKILHPETEKSHNHGAVLENHSESHVEEPHYEHYHHE